MVCFHTMTEGGSARAFDPKISNFMFVVVVVVVVVVVALRFCAGRCMPRLVLTLHCALYQSFSIC